MKMDVRYNNPFVNELEEPGFVSDVTDSPPPAGVYKQRKLNSISTPKKSKQGVHKRVVTVPITDAHGSRLKGEGAPPPSDSWAWRKYGQKPIKGSPYPRGYYKCSSSKGCPARKQVERSRLDPTMLVITYACEHNHTWPPASKYTTARATKTTTTAVDTEEEQNNALLEEETPVLITRPGSKLEPETRFADLGDESLITTDDFDFSWFSDVESTLLDTTPMYTEDNADVAMIFPIMREEDESLFADLGELPECSLVFKESRRCSSSLRAYCESTR